HPHAGGGILQDHARALGRLSRVGPVTKPVDDADEHPVIGVADAGEIAADVLALLGHRRGLDQQRAHLPTGRRQCHFSALISVPEPSSDVTSNSSMRRRTPGRPIPRLRLVEYPSWSARLTSAIPGPWSRATISSPRRPPASSTATS